MVDTMKCPKCGGEMEEGFIVDRGVGLSNVTKSSWTTKIKIMGLENERETTTYRCKSCGFLESWAK